VSKSIYDFIPCDSAVERLFVQKLGLRNDVRHFVKLPAWFKVPTPVGQYNPDWGLVMAQPDALGGEVEGRPLLYLVRETKSSRRRETFAARRPRRLTAAAGTSMGRWAWITRSCRRRTSCREAQALCATAGFVFFLFPPIHTTARLAAPRATSTVAVRLSGLTGQTASCPHSPGTDSTERTAPFKGAVRPLSQSAALGDASMRRALSAQSRGAKGGRQTRKFTARLDGNWFDGRRCEYC